MSVRSIIINILILLVLTAATVGSTLASSVHSGDAQPDPSDANVLLRDRIRAALALRAPAARVELTGAIRWTKGELPARSEQVVILNENARGEAIFSVRDDAGEISEGLVTYAAWIPSRTAIKRILPGERLSADKFVVQDVNVASGAARDYRGVILGLEGIGTDVAKLEARQTILEGQFLMSTAVQRVPDVRRGDSVRIQVISNGLTLTTQGTAEEPAYVDSQLRVLSGKTKRSLVGKLSSEGVVEVRL